MAGTRLHAPQAQAVTFVELFFDLVFVFAVTEVTALTAHHLDPAGVARSGVLFWLIWWAWTQFTWTLSPADTRHPRVQALTLVASGVAFIMAASVTGAFGDQALWFAIPYVIIRSIGIGLQVRIDQERAGEGVGTVTLPGLGLEVGGPAINPVPRQNIADNLREVAPALLAEHGLEVCISVPGGQEMAKKTTNARLGILGGISILGTTGIVRPYSTAAWRASVVQSIQVAATVGHGLVALTTGGRTESFAIAALRAERPELPQACFVQMGDFLRYALDEAVARGLREVVIAGMVGKLTKIAQGETITHANRAEVDTALLARLAAEVGAPPDECAAIAAAETARFAAERMAALGRVDAFHTRLAQAVVATLSDPTRYGGRFRLQVLVCDFEGQKLAEAASAPCC